MTDSNSAGAFAGLVLAAYVTKLVASVDDVVWLLPFVVKPPTRREKLINSAVYVVLFELMVLMSTGVALAFRELMSKMMDDSDEGGWTPETVMSMISAGLLLVYAVYQFKYGGDDDDDAGDDAGDATKVEEGAAGADQVEVTIPEGGEAEKAAMEPTTVGKPAESPSGAGEKQASVAKENTATPRKLVVVGFLGGLDDLAIQVSLLIAGMFTVFHLAIGVLLGCSTVLAVCWGASGLRPVVNLVEKIPLWLIVLILGLFTGINALVDVYA
mmetsp:Transcript_12090/g.26784  ORF Transcript_12090/g.26784 Transcript_12090/m.26784 type:complete len:270 (-) Transcript_12090:240-1049(-)|eukprot:CAMPEP_0204391522 /NCGR_PEP_ID=MMETSP0469-20131031/61290_1 /ASSEMBLY_ACC=CAM_ASM_000384 /TAXON_ID=2969 /ORGANISM="Oxyrrhis marina" /LENGTH=269 /DNA_ID=CAMNT_0051385477 /DNA_START=54 /DNA_END=863 /DNA_ORIENTATION=-